MRKNNKKLELMTEYYVSTLDSRSYRGQSLERKFTPPLHFLTSKSTGSNMFLMTTIRSSFEAFSSLSTQSNNLKQRLSILSLEKATLPKYCMVSLNKKQISKLNITKKNADEIECHILVLSLPFFILLFLFLFRFKRSIKHTFHLKMSLVNEMD